MKTTTFWLKRYRAFIVLAFINFCLLLFLPDIGKQSLVLTKANIIEMISIIPPIFILLGLLDVWVEKETMVKYMGSGSGFKGSIIAFILGSAAAGPLYAAFPLAGIFLKKGVSLLNVFLFIGAWSTTKIPLLLFESSNLGANFMFVRLFLNIIGIFMIAFLLEKTTSSSEKEALYENAKNL